MMLALGSLFFVGPGSTGIDEMMYSLPNQKEAKAHGITVA